MPVTPDKNVEKTAQDWVRDLRFSNQVNMQTMGVDTDRVTPDLLLASSNKLLGISQGKTEGDMKDSLQFQRIYGPVEYFAERIQKDGGSVARQMLWKATNKGNLDFIGAGSLQPHVNAVFHESNLSQFVDNSTPMEGVDTSQKVTRIGEGGLSDEDSAPIEMRLVQPSYYGFVDPVRTAERCYDKDTEIFTKKGWKSVTEMALDDEFAVLIDGKPSWAKPISLQSYDHDGPMYCYENCYINFAVTGSHRMYTAKTKESPLEIEEAETIFGNTRFVMCAPGKASKVDESQKWFYFPELPEEKLGRKNIEKVNIVDFAEFMGWYLSEGSCDISKSGHGTPDYRVRITQSPYLHPEYYEEIRELVERLPFGAHPKPYNEARSEDITIKRKQLYYYLEQFGGSKEKFIPEWIFNAPTEARWAFVGSLLKGDGSDQRDLNTISIRLAKDFARLLYELGQSCKITASKQNYITVKGEQAGDIYQVTWHKLYKHELTGLNKNRQPKSGKGWYIQYYKGKVYCPTVPGGLVYVRRNNCKGFWCGNSPGITAYLTKNVMKGTDGKLYQKFINMHTGQVQMVDSQTAAKKIVTTDEYLDSSDSYVYAIGGPRGIRIVKRSDVDYILPHSDDAFSTAANTVPMISGIKAMRLLMGCHHPDTPIAVVDSQGYTHIVPAKRLSSMGQLYVLGCNKKGQDQLYPIRKVITRVPEKKSKFKKIILSSGRLLITSQEHKWWIYDKDFKLVQAKDLEKGMQVPRSLFSSMPVRPTDILGVPVTREICVLMGRLVRSLKASSYSYRVDFVVDPDREVNQKKDIEKALQQLGIKNYNFFYSRGLHAVSIKDPVFQDWADLNVGAQAKDRKIPSAILSLPQGYTSIFLDSYYKDLQSIGEDTTGDTWLLSIANPSLRDSLSFMLNKIYTDTRYRDVTRKDYTNRALQLLPAKASMGDIVLEKITKVLDVSAPAVMIDIDCDDNVYAAANGVITHNSKYCTQAVPLPQREAPLIRALDTESGMDMPTRMGKLLGTQWAPKAGMVKAVREDRIDMIYDDGTTGSVPLYKNFPANAKGWLTNYPKVKAGDKVAEGQLLASSNYTDDNGVLAMGRNLRIGYMSYHGGTYEDACTLSQSAAKKMGYTTMYKTDMDKDKSIRTAKKLYTSWKPGQYTKEQLDNIGDDGVVKVGATVNKGDPVILGIRTTEPSPGTLGKRILSDVTEVWEHANPGTVTDVVNGKNGIKVFATVSSPLKEGDKISNFFGGKGTCYSADTQVLTKKSWKYFKDLTDDDQVAVLGIDGIAHFQKPSARQVFDYQGQLYGYKSKMLSWLVTPDHYMWTCPTYVYQNRGPEFKRTPVEQVWGEYVTVQVAAPFEDVGTKTQITIPDVDFYRPIYKGSKQLTWPINDFAAFLGFYLAQGCLNHSNNIRITQKRDLLDPQSCIRCDKIQSLLAKMNLPWRRDGLHYQITHKALREYLKQFGKSSDKFIPEQVFTEWPHEAQLILLEWLYIGDGQKYGKAKRLRVISPRLVDDAQRLYLLNGYTAVTHHNYHDRHRIYKGQPVIYSALHGVSFNNLCYRGMDRHTGKNTSYPGYYKQLYEGKVYCCTVSTGVILVQRQGKPMWCGNCAQIIPDEKMPRDSKGRPLELLYDPLGIVSRCYDEKTEFLTEDGWKLGKDIEDSEKILSWDIKTETFNFLPQQEPFYKKQYKGTMYKASNEVVQLQVTPHHKVSYKWPGQDTVREGFIQDIYGKSCFLPKRDLFYRAQRATKWGFISCIDWSQVKYEGTVYCPTVSTGYVLTRRNGKEIVAHNTNPSQLMQAGLGKVAAKTGQPITVPAFMPKGQSRLQYVKDLMKKNNVPWKEDVYDPETGRTIKNVYTGVVYFLPLKHIADTKMSARGTAKYSADEVPLGGGQQGSKRIGNLECSALVGHNVFNFLQDAKLIRGQQNSDFWRSIRTGQIPVVPGEPLAHKKFFAHLQASGMQIKRDNEGVTIFALSNKDVDELAGTRELKSTDTYEQKSFRPIDGGLFGQDIFGPLGDKWAYIQLDSPLPNPVMEEPLARLLNIPDKEFQAIVRGKGSKQGLRNASDMKKVLSKMDLQKEADRALVELKASTKSKKDNALKRYVAIARMRDAGVRPQEYMLDRIPVLPPKFRPITSHGDLTMVADSNYLYSQLLNARDDLREAQGLPQEYKEQGLSNLYSKWKELVGLYDPSDVKLKSKNVKGLLKWALGTSPKWSAYQMKVLGSTVDTVGRGVIIPSTKIKLNQVGMPVQMAWNLYSPFVTRKLVQSGYSPVDALKLIKQRKPVAMEALVEAVKERPCVINRAPSLHKLSLIGLNTKLTNGHAIKINPSIVSTLAADFDGNCCDFDSEIIVKVSKSGLDKLEKGCRLYQTLTKESNMITTETRIEIRKEENNEASYGCIKIGEFPRFGTPVKDKNGADVYKVPEGYQVEACDPVTGERGFYDIEALTVEDNCDTVKVEAGNHSVIVSSNESLAVFDTASGKLTKVAPKDLNGRLVPILKKDVAPFGTSGNRDVGWLIGSLISDGWVTANVVGYAKLEEAKRKEIERIFRDIDPNFLLKEYTEQPEEGKNKLGASAKIHIYSPNLAEFVRQLNILDEEGDMSKKTACRKQINRNLIRLGSEEFLWGILSGLIDGDGSIIMNTTMKNPRFGVRYSTSSPSLRDTFCALLYRLGIRYSITTTPPRNWSNEAYTICPSTIDMYENIDKLTCIGSREKEMIQKWKDAAPVYEDKKDQVPVSDEEWEALKKVCNNKTGGGIYYSCMKKKLNRSVARYLILQYSTYLKLAAPSLLKRAEEKNTLWYPAEVTEDTGKRQVFDLMVKDAKVFAVNNGFVIWDTVNLHVPVSQKAVQDVRQKMMPQRNLISLRKGKTLYKPQKAYTQGLYVATRMGQAKDIKAFNSIAEARKEYLKGNIDIDTPIVIKES